MLKIKLASAVLALIYGLSMTEAFAYPQSNGTVDFNETYNVPETESWKPSPSENIFTVDGKSFILLDTDIHGNYFVVAEEHYGTHAFETGIVNKVELAKAVTENGQTTFTDYGANLNDTDSWRFNPQRKTNVGYWLNHDFVTDGNTKQHQFPKRVYDYILERSWQIEGFAAYRGWTAAQHYDTYFGLTTAADIAAAYKGDTYSKTAKLSLLSYNEYIEYKDKIGVTFTNPGGWSGMMLRTCDALVTGAQSGNTRTLTLTRSPLLVRPRSADISDRSNLYIGYADAISSDYYYIRPCFWLSEDFFKEVPCELEWDKNGNPSIGNAPLAKIKAHTYQELKAIYTDGQLEALGYSTPTTDMNHYPQHSSEVADLKAGESGGTGLPAYYTSPPENLFTVDGKTFILLDKDKNGNYLIMANEEYGQRVFTHYSSPTGNKQWMENDWRFDPENSNSIAYWLNHQFLTTGNRFKGGTEYLILPNSIQANLLTSDWEIEPHYPILSWTVNSYANDSVKAEILQWQQTQIAAAKKQVVRCKVALMSFTEYQQYKEKIGLTVLADSYAGFSLRTPRSQATAVVDGNSWNATVGQLQVSNHPSSDRIIFSTGGANNDIYYVRPVFWLSKRFFAENAVSIETLGENVKNEIAYSYDYYDLRNTYPAETIRDLGINPNRWGTSAVPAAEEVAVEGIAAVGLQLTGRYVYHSNEKGSDAAAERNSTYAWYLSNTEDGSKILCSTERSYTPKIEDAGKYLHFSVTPKNAYGISATKAYFSRPVLIAQAVSTSVESVLFTNSRGDELNNLNGTDTLHVDLKFTSSDGCIIYVLAYDVDGKLMGMQTESVSAGTYSKKLTLANLASGGGSYARVLIFKSNDLTKPVYSRIL